MFAHRIRVSCGRSLMGQHASAVLALTGKRGTAFALHGKLQHCQSTPAIHSWRFDPSRSFATSKDDNDNKTGSDHHEFFQEQMAELQAERTAMFGSDNQSMTKPPSEPSPSPYSEDMEDLLAERDALFQFTNEERQAWTGNPNNGSTNLGGNSTLPPDLLEEIAKARAAAEAAASSPEISHTPPVNEPLPHHESFTHLSSDSKSIHMVDVGSKQVTTRTAHAQSKVLLPPSVLEAFALDNAELVGPKGPIFATAKLAGIMAAKKTSDLIPLCHPLPLDQVKIDISLVNGGTEVIIDCICKVTHKTGVEMEALTGASVAALTIYDMVKAVSHQVEITDTRLVTKEGGKRSVRNPVSR